MSLSIYSKASTDLLLGAKASLSGATFTGTVEAPNFTITAGSGGVLTFSDGTTMSTAGGGGGGATWGSITGSISSQTDLQTEFANYLPLAGGTMTGALYSTYGTQSATFFGSVISIADGSYQTVMQPTYIYATNGSAVSYFTPTYIQFADGTTQTTAASGGLDAIGAFYAGVCSNLYSALYQWNYYASPNQFIFNSYFNAGSVYPPFTAGTTSNALTSGNIGLTTDGVNFYAIDYYSGTYLTSSTFPGASSGVYLAFKDGSGTWHQCPVAFA